MGRRSNAWKDLERQVAKSLKGDRVYRGGDFSKKDVDVVVHDFPNFQIDAKYRQRWSHHKFYDEVVTKYCAKPEDIALLVTKHPKQRGAIVSLSLDHFAILLELLREMRGSEE